MKKHLIIALAFIGLMVGLYGAGEAYMIIDGIFEDSHIEYSQPDAMPGKIEKLFAF